MTWDITDYSATPSANTAINGINIGEGCNASNINDALRQLMADLASYTSSGSGNPPGTIIYSAATAIPSGYLYCDGSAVSRVTYPALFTALGSGSVWGAGDGSTTFNVPDYRGRTPIGAGTGTGLTSRLIAVTGGQETHVLTLSEVPADSVSVSGTTGAGSPHTHTVTDPGHQHELPIGNNNSGSSDPGHGGGGTSLSADYTVGAYTGITLATEGAHTHTFAGSGATNGAGGAHNNMQPFAVANVFIKT